VETARNVLLRARQGPGHQGLGPGHRRHEGRRPARAHHPVRTRLRQDRLAAHDPRQRAARVRRRPARRLGETTAAPRKTAARGARPTRTPARCTALLALAATLALTLGGCGSTRRATPQEERLERADLIAVARTLASQEPAARAEVTATKAAWPLIAGGLPADTTTISSAAVRHATQRAATLTLPGLLAEAEAKSITGPASSLAGLYRWFATLATRGWQLIGGAIQEIQHGSPAAARFARANVDLYIESIYDAHYDLAQIGKQLPIDYKRLGGDAGFGTSLTPAEVASLSHAYSEAQNRLYPHVRTRFGS
jgi:hypothetical protein